MSQRARRIVAMACCTLGGSWALLGSVANMQRHGHPMVTLLLFLLALFLLLSVVGLARPWLGSLRRTAGPGRSRSR